MTNLDRLNQLLQPLNLPEFRKTVSQSFANLDWLRNHAHKKNEVGGELKTLLEMSQKQLLLDYQK